MKLLRYPAAALFFLVCTSLSGQDTSRLDSLLSGLKNEKSDTGRVILLYRIAYEYQFSDLSKSLDYALQAVERAEKAGFDRGKGNALIQMGNIEQLKGNTDEAEKLNIQAIEILTRANDLAGISIAYNNLGILAHNRNELDEALSHYRKALDISRKTGRLQGEANSLFCIGTVHENRAGYDSALIYYLSGLRISESINDERLMAYAKLSLANVCFQMDDLPGALNYYIEVIRFYEKTRNHYGLMKTYLSTGQIYSRLDSIRQALWYFRQVANTALEVQSQNDAANAWYSIAGLFESQGLIDSAKTYYLKAGLLYKETFSMENYSLTLVSLARLHNISGENQAALTLLDEAIDIAEGKGLPQVLTEASREMAITLSLMGKFREAFYYLNRYAEIKDSLMTVEKQKQILELQTQYETEKKESENELLRKDRQILQATRNSLIIGALLLVIIALVIFRSLTIKKRDNLLLKKQKEEIRQQKEIVEKQKTEITDSIKYAKRIQSAILPPAEIIGDLLPDSFILYLPKDIVSGDFFHVRQISRDIILVCAADCTGHGVPGAFMSMLGMSLLNDIINTRQDLIAGKEFTPAMILNELRERVKISLRQTGREGEARDGMDMSLCILDRGMPEIHYAGANNSVYYVHNGQLTEMKATRNPIGIYLNEVSFSDTAARIEKGTVVYMFSDGYSDQTGPGGKKFLSKNFKALLSEISGKGMEDIRNILHKRHLDWKGDEEQVDDILVIGIRV